MKFTSTLFSILCALCGSTISAAEKPNVLFILCDDLNDYIGVLGGHPQAKTPNIDRLFKSGVTFTQAHCNVPICAPSRSSLFTGLYPHTSANFGFANWDENPVLKNNRTVMDHFRANGYQTMGTGKLMHNRDRKEWQQYGHPVDYGPLAKQGEKEVAHPDTPAPFRDDFGSIDGSLGPLKNLEGTGFSWITGGWPGMKTLRYVTDDDRDPTHDELNTQWVVENLRKLAAQPKAKPFLMGVGFMRPHTPLIVPQKYFDLFPLETIQLPEIKAGDAEDTFKHTVTAEGDDRGRKIHDSLIASFGNDRELALKKFIQAYLACIASVDDHVGKILEALDASPLKENTIVVLTSDHGWQMGQKAYLYKNSLWQESTRIPLAIRAPGVAKDGGQCPRPVSLIDLYPTLVDLCGLPTDTKKNEQGRALDGHSLKPLLADPENGTWTGPDSALTAMSKWGTTYDPAQQSYSLRSQDWRYIRYENGKEELYHVTGDPREWTNLATNPEHAKQLEGYRTQLLAMIPKSNPAAKPATAGTAEEWKDTFFKSHPAADANGDGTLSWPEYKDYKKRLDAGEFTKPKGKPKGNPKTEPKSPAAPAASQGRLQTTGTFSKTTDGGLTFTDQAGGQVFHAINELAAAVEPHLDKPVKIVANVKQSTKGKAMMMVYLVSIHDAEAGAPQPKNGACLSGNKSETSVNPIRRENGFFAYLPDKVDPLRWAGTKWVNGKQLINDPSLNYARFFGSDWEKITRKGDLDRMQSWGLNTLVCWSDEAMQKEHRLPYTLIASPWWQPDNHNAFPSPFSEDFESKLSTALEKLAWAKDDPFLIGVFLGNELDWPDEITSTLFEEPTDSATKAWAIEKMRQKYSGLDGLNTAWKTQHTDWKTILTRASKDEIPKAVRADLEPLYLEFATTFFRRCKAALESVLPGTLYLGCRTHRGPKFLGRAAVGHVDVFSVNVYDSQVRADQLTPDVDLPIVSSEFHFGAVDRGVPSPGLVGVGDQRQRGLAFANYLASALADPRFVGVHWFQWLDQSAAGRPDPENHAVGFLDVTGRAHREFVETVSKATSRSYEVRTSKQASVEKTLGSLLHPPTAP